MAQYSAGTCALTNGSATVVGAPGAFWATVPVGAFFIRSGQPMAYQISSVVLIPAAGAVAAYYQLTLTAPYGGATEAAALYVIHTSFTSKGFPIWSVGDTETVALINRLTLLLESNTDTLPNTDTNPPTRQKIAVSGTGDGAHIVLPAA